MSQRLAFENSRFASVLGQLESGITSGSLSPSEAVVHLAKMFQQTSAICATLTPSEHANLNALKSDFRLAIAPWFSQSWFMNRALQKPRGYPGDYEILEAIYAEKPRSQGIGEALDLYFLQSALARAVRGRKDWIRDFLHHALSSRPGTPRVLDIACGPCREIREFVRGNGKSSFVFHGLDLDEEALAFAKSALEESGFPPENVSFSRQNVLRLVPDSREVKAYGKFDLIYSIGLYDYLRDETLVQVLRGTAGMLADQGQYLIAFKDCDRYDCTEYQWAVDWYFYQRTEAQCRKLLEESQLQILSMDRDPSGVVMLFTAAAKP